MTDTELTTTEPTEEIPAASVTIKVMEEEIANLLSKTDVKPEVPKIGFQISGDLMRCFQQTAADIVRIADEHVERALVAKRAALQLSDDVLRAGQRYCREIEETTAKGCQISFIMQKARKIIDNNGP